MDLVLLIKDKLKWFETTPQRSGIDAVIHHIDIAVRHHARAKAEGDDFLYTDVIYRANHAFEGILKVAYAILTGDDPSKMTPHKIEQYLDSTKILRERVLYLFTNYRQQWRNPSTHDYLLFFSEQEAFLALVNICAFVNILLDQLLEKIAFDREKDIVDKADKSIAESSPDYKSLPLYERAIFLLKHFSEQLPKNAQVRQALKEIEILGMLSAFIESNDPEISSYREVAVGAGSRTLRPDLILQLRNDKVIVEVKKYRASVRQLELAKEQVFTYLSAANIDKAILYFVPEGMAVKQGERVTRSISGIDQEVFMLGTPRAA